MREPQLIVWGLFFPIMFVLLFAYVFGSGIIVPGGGNYREFLMAGMFAQTMAFGIGETMMSVHTDAAKGVTDRFRSMPMAPSAVVVGRCIANMIYSAISLAILVGTGLAIGWRWHGTLGEAVAAFGLLLLLRLAFMWIGIWLGLKATSPEMVNSVYGILYPVTMLSSAFIAIELMPGWLGAIADVEPDLGDDHRRPAGCSTTPAWRRPAGWPTTPRSWRSSGRVAITVVTLPLAVRAYQRLSR